MSIFLCSAIVTKSQFAQVGAKTEMQAEEDLFEAKRVELAREFRRQRISRVTGGVSRVWARVLDRLTRRSRDAQAKKDLHATLEGMPAYMLQDMGVTRDNAGRFCYHDDYGMLVELVPAGQKPTVAKAEAPATAQGPQAALATR